ncbi:MAG: tRNA pseudouridine(55) synthase TruB [Lactobacillales bacterium]|jgi:tRNA pseudouridine55 synthase|nr:tRNA pseudouridine(55) synthase TruB [Lactobacillales bacterium]
MDKIINQIDGWLVIDKPYQMGSTDVVTKLKRFLHPSKIGHGGTLDPLATGVLPIALGKATRLIPYVMDDEKVYEFEVTWGTQTTTDDIEGEALFTSNNRPERAAIEKIIPAFLGVVDQLPPAYSALKVDGKRAYDLARRGVDVNLKPRPVRIDSLEIITHAPDKTAFRVKCGKGTYVRSLGRDFGQMLDCYGHISQLRRIKNGPFSIKNAILLEKIENGAYTATTLEVLPLETVLGDIPVLAVGKEEALRLILGQTLGKSFAKGLPETFSGNIIRVVCQNQLIALVKIQNGCLKPFRVFAAPDSVSGLC